MIKVWIVGRPNVWKSTLFNRLIWSHRAIVTEIEGTTRDVLQEKTFINNYPIVFLDTPGLGPEDDFQKVGEIIKDADLLIFMVDWKFWLNVGDYKIASLIHKSGKKNNTLVIVNKLDWKDFDKFSFLSWDFFQLGFEEIKPLSLKTWKGLDEVKKWLVSNIEKVFKNVEMWFNGDKDRDYVPIAIMGRPNVWKSTLFNRFVGEEMAKVSNEAGTTLDYNKWEIQFRWTKFQIFDLVGIRRKGKIGGLEKIAMHKLQKMLEYIKPVVVVLIDLIEGVTHRDLTLLKEVFENYKLPTIVVFNKIDAFEGDLKSKVKELGNFSNVLPLLTISAKTGKNLHKLLELGHNLHRKFYFRVSTSELNKLVRQKYLLSPPTFPKNKVVKVGYVTQIWEAPPTFKVFVNRKDWVTLSFKRWIEKVLRRSYDLKGIPLVFEFENK